MSGTNSSPVLNACDQILGVGTQRAGADAPAILFGDDVLSYGELARLVARFGNALRRDGVGRGDRVLILYKDCPELVAAWLATVKIGAVAIVLNLRSAAKDIRFVLDDSACRAAVVDDELAATFAEALVEADHRPRLLVTSGDVAVWLGDAADTLESAPTTADDMAYWLYTSGTTGSPKAAVHLHGGVLVGDRHMRENLGVRPGDRLFSSSKLFFAFALGHLLIGGLRCGATLVLYDGWPDSTVIAEIVARHRPDVLFSVPTFYRNLLRDGHAAGFHAVRHCVSAGERMPESIHQAWLDAVGKPLLEGIGTTETMFLMIAATPDAWCVGATGRPLPWVEVRLETEAGDVATAPGNSGVLWVRMDSLAQGYWNQPDKTAAAFRDGWYRTGDLFRIDADGWWHHLGRGDDMLKVSGQWVSPGEIEEVALAVPGVADAAVVGAANAEGLVRLAMFLVPGGGESESRLTERVQEAIKGQLSIYKCPRTVRLIEEMPRTPTGKLQRFRLRQMLEAS